MSEKGFMNVAYFVFDYLVDVIWILVRTVFSPAFIIWEFMQDDKPRGSGD